MATPHAGAVSASIPADPSPLSPVTDAAALVGVDGAVEALDALHSRLSAGERGPDVAAGLLTVAGLLTGLAGSYAPPAELGRVRTVWTALDRAADGCRLASEASR